MKGAPAQDVKANCQNNLFGGDGRGGVTIRQEGFSNFFLQKPPEQSLRLVSHPFIIGLIKKSQEMGNDIRKKETGRLCFIG